MAVQLALTPDSRWEISTAGLVEAAAKAGFAAVGLSADRSGGDARAAYAAAGLRCHEVLALMLTDDAAATIASAERLAAAAETVRAEWVLTVFRAPLTSETAKVIERCAAIIAGAGSRMAVEFSPFGPISSIPRGLEVVEAAGPGRAGLMIDSWHFCVGVSTWEQLSAVPLEQIAYVQFSDASDPLSADLMVETMERRALPGEGILELDRFASTLLDRGWVGLVSLEILSNRLRQMPVPEFARFAYDAAAPYWA